MASISNRATAFSASWHGSFETTCDRIRVAATIEYGDDVNHRIGDTIVDGERKSLGKFAMQPVGKFVNSSLRFQLFQV